MTKWTAHDSPTGPAQADTEQGRDRTSSDLEPGMDDELGAVVEDQDQDQDHGLERPPAVPNPRRSSRAGAPSSIR